jgi:hypothetical protein
VLNTLIAAAMFWDASQSTSGNTDWAHWFADGGVLLINVIVGDAVLMNIIEVMSLDSTEILIPRRAKETSHESQLSRQTSRGSQLSRPFDVLISLL